MFSSHQERILLLGLLLATALLLCLFMLMSLENRNTLEQGEPSLIDMSTSTPDSSMSSVQGTSTATDQAATSSGSDEAPANTQLPPQRQEEENEITTETDEGLVPPAVPERPDEVVSSIYQANEIGPNECAGLREDSPFYADPEAQAIRIEQELRAAGRAEAATLLREIACFPHPTWLLGDDEHGRTMAKVRRVAAASEAAGKIPVFVLYNRPMYGSARWGSGLSTSEYQDWIEGIARSIGSAPAWVILEPDALPTAAAYSDSERNKRIDELATAVSTFADSPSVRVYIDAGHSGWLTIQKAAELLRDANVEEARGFSLNVANYRTTPDEEQYGRMLAAVLPGKHFVIDTARNGNGPARNGEWCNTRGRALGERPKLFPDTFPLDAYLWAKPPGESDGTCNGGPPAGTFWLDYALELVHNSRD